MLLNYHIGRFVLGSLCVGDLVRMGLSGVRVAGWSFSLQVGLLFFNYYNDARSNKRKISVLLTALHGQEAQNVIKY